MTDEVSEKKQPETPLEVGIRVNTLAKQFARTSPTKTIYLTDEAGASQPFVIKRFGGLDDYAAIGKKTTSRLETLKKLKSIPVTIQASDIEGLESFFPDFKLGKDGKGTIEITTEAGILIATNLEGILESPVMTWAEAVIFMRIAGNAASVIYDEFNKLNKVEALDEAKNE